MPSPVRTMRWMVERATPDSSESRVTL